MSADASTKKDPQSVLASGRSKSSFEDFLRYLEPESKNDVSFVKDQVSHSALVATQSSCHTTKTTVSSSSRADGTAGMGASGSIMMTTASSGRAGLSKKRQSSLFENECLDRRQRLSRHRSSLFQGDNNKITFQGVSFTVPVKGRFGLPTSGNKTILSGVSGKLKSGNVVAGTYPTLVWW